MNCFERITTDPKVMYGRPSIRNMRFTVSQMLELVAGGMTFEEILADYPYIKLEDIQACLYFAAKIADTKQILAIT